MRIWEVDCGLMDWILALSFDSGELANCFQSAGLDSTRCACLPDSTSAILLAHAASHQQSPLAELLERRLDCVHGAGMRGLPADPALVAEPIVLGADLPRDLGTRLWALGTSRAAQPVVARLKAAISARTSLVLAEHLNASAVLASPRT